MIDFSVLEINDDYKYDDNYEDDDNRVFFSDRKAKTIMEWCPIEEDMQCPVCGNDCDEYGAVWYSQNRSYVSFECMSAVEWDELHKCKTCKSYYLMVDQTNC